MITIIAKITKTRGWVQDMASKLYSEMWL